MKLNFKSGFIVGFAVALILVPLELKVCSGISNIIVQKRGLAKVCVRTDTLSVSAGINKYLERYKVTDYDGTNAFAPIYSKVEKNDIDFDKMIIDNGYRYYKGDKVSKIGVDVSKYQNDIDWVKVKQSGIDFAIIRVGYRGYGSEGKIVLDENFNKHIQGAADAGLPVGVYFFSQAVNEEEAIEEAQAVINAIKGYNITYPVIFDTEYIPNSNARANDLSKDDLTRISSTFCEEIKKSGYEPMLYANEKWFLLHLDLRELNEYPLWFAGYRDEITFPYKIKMWQYTESGTVDGIDGNVDLNIMFE